MNDSETKAALRRSFHTVFLLTGNLEDTERALLVAIEFANGTTSTEEFRNLALRAAIIGRSARPFDSLPEAIDLPPELERVLQLEPEGRRVFVLRFLAGWTGEKCAEILRLKESVVDELACAAVIEVARLRREEMPRRDPFLNERAARVLALGQLIH